MRTLKSERHGAQKWFCHGTCKRQDHLKNTPCFVSAKRFATKADLSTYAKNRKVHVLITRFSVIDKIGVFSNLTTDMLRNM